MTDKKEPQGKFIVRKITQIDDFKVGNEIPESDLLIKNHERVVQFEYEEPEEEKSEKYEAKPGTYNIGYKGNSITLNKLELRSKPLLTSYDTTKRIKEEALSFFNNLDRYDKIGEEKRRALLLYSPPGYGKTSGISRLIKDLIEEDKDTIAINWPTGTIRSSEANAFLSNIDYNKHKCSRLVLVIEDIGGGEKEDYHGRERSVDSSLLNLLDGVDNIFPIPTFIVATTNHPGSLLDALADRPGRFDEYVELEPPNEEQRVDLIEFISKRKCTEQEKEDLKKAKHFSPAHLSEVVKRSFLKDKTYGEVINELINHKDRVSKRFEKRATSGIGL